MAIVFPFVILLTITVVQASMWYFARNIALTAAREGADAGRLYQATPADGAARARATLGRIAGDSLRGAQVSVNATADQVQITVTGTAPSMLPLVPGLRISQSASGTRERWTTPAGGR
ncbi:pilus assembly protein [Streptomyces sp. PTM05]|uniref:Pilus assembly protein n=1 Tax=Streptantibioticus parmotrematis TaxID=2873249 RepID=A0ABS7R3F2_9ACTN|nr:TadE family protein [Streptantibioticus parmotrematis]MBY8889429.1 pilus assembly protein [Streptantibioticus parmotrematis]